MRRPRRRRATSTLAERARAGAPSRSGPRGRGADRRTRSARPWMVALRSSLVGHGERARATRGGPGPLGVAPPADRAGHRRCGACAGVARADGQVAQRRPRRRTASSPACSARWSPRTASGSAASRRRLGSSTSTSPTAELPHGDGHLAAAGGRARPTALPCCVTSWLLGVALVPQLGEPVTHRLLRGLPSPARRPSGPAGRASTLPDGSGVARVGWPDRRRGGLVVASAGDEHVVAAADVVHLRSDAP